MLLLIKKRSKKGIIWVMALSLMLVEFGGCKAPAKIFRIGIITITSINNDESLKGFKSGMAELGYVEGENIEYIYKGVIEGDEKNIEAGIKEVLAQDVTLLVTFGKGASLHAKELVKKNNVPVLFASEAFPVEDGLVESLKHPGGNMTGVKPADSISKTLEWLAMITPKTKKVFLPYDPDDLLSTRVIPEIEKSASQLGIGLVLYKVYSVGVAVAAIENLPEDIDAVFLIPSLTLNPGSKELSQAAMKRKIPMGASILLDESPLITLTSDYFDAGKKMARLAQQINQGAKSSDLPVETAEVKLIINLKTAEKIGITIPDDILVLAKSIIR